MPPRKGRIWFQSPNGFIGLSAPILDIGARLVVESFNPQTGSSAFQPVWRRDSDYSHWQSVSIPKRVHRPFSRGRSPRSSRRRASFNPQTGSSAFQPFPACFYSQLGERFQSPNGFIGLSACNAGTCVSGTRAVSIPKRVHRPFSPNIRRAWQCLTELFQSPNGFIGLSA